MQYVTMYGSSDDLVEVEGIIGGDEFNGEEVRLSVGGVLAVDFEYALIPGSCWGVTITQIDEDLPIPDDWKVTISQNSNGYSVQVNMEIPDGISIVQRY